MGWDGFCLLMEIQLGNLMFSFYVVVWEGGFYKEVVIQEVEDVFSIVFIYQVQLKVNCLLIIELGLGKGFVVLMGLRYQ